MDFFRGVSRTVQTILALGILGSIAMPLGATPVVVNTLADENDGSTVGLVSLREALSDAGSSTEPVVIQLSLNGTYTLSSLAPAIRTTVTVTGISPLSTTISGGGSSRIFFVDGGALTLENLTLHGGFAKGGNGARASGGVPAYNGSGGGGAGLGAGVFLNSGSLMASQVAFTSHTVVGGRGGGADFPLSSGSGGGIGSDAGSNGPGNGYPFEPLRHGQDGIGGFAGSSFIGGFGSPGGFGAGGGAGVLPLTLQGGSGGNGGFGGGGGGGSANNGGGGTSPGGFGGSGGGLNNDSGCGGGGGAGLGAAIFARTGTTLELRDCSFSQNWTIGGILGNQSSGSGSQLPTFGKGKGAGIFVMSGVNAAVRNLTFSGNVSANATGSGFTPNTLSDTSDVYGTLAVINLAAVDEWPLY